MTKQAMPANVTDISPVTEVHPEHLLRLPKVMEIVSVSRPTIYAMMKRGEFPQSRKIGHVAVWKASEVAAWVERLWSNSNQVA
jgi:prophage regulatory protein